jgi:hypothetical protein
MALKNGTTPTSTKTLLAFLAIIVVGFVSLHSNEKTIFFEDSTPIASHSMTVRIYDGNMTSPDVDFTNRMKMTPIQYWAPSDNLTCVEEGVPTYPLDDDWQRRAPYALLVGAMKAGTTALSAYLGEHPHVAKAMRKEIHFFDVRFANFQSENGILRGGARRQYANIFQRVGAGNLTKQNPAMISIDDTPRYLFWSHFIPARVLCVAPWVKIIAILRNPIDRAYSQFNMNEHANYTGLNISISFEEWVQRDLDDLKRVGVIQDAIPQQNFSGSEVELTAWKDYIRLGTHAPVGRGLYAIQLRHWFKAFEEFGKSRTDDFLIVQSERMKKYTKFVYQDILTFLNLSSFTLPDLKETETFKGNYSESLNEGTRRKLDKFYAPYNSELYDLLGRHWEGVWDAKK